jgi:signal transduction histidine kinase/ActR/RegA family two-component response regulator
MRGRRPERALDTHARRIGKSINLLILVSTVVFVVAMTMFGGLRERQRGMRAAARESVVWAVFQGRVEVKDFIEAIVLAMSGQPGSGLDEVLTRYDVLYSRAAFFEQGTYAVHASQYADLRSISTSVHDAVVDLAPRIDAVAGQPQRLQALLPDLLAAARKIDDQVARLVAAAKVSSNIASVSDREAVRDLYQRTAMAVVALMAVIGLIVVLQRIQLRQIAGAGRQMEILSERNARAAEAAEAGTRAKSAFLAAMSHEIRTPLNGIIGMTEILARGPLSGEQAEQVAVIGQSGGLLLEIISDILDFSKVESGRVEIEVRDFPLVGVLETVRSVMLPRLTEKGLALEIDVPDLVIQNDPSRLRQILVNLVGNAVKFTPRGGIRLSAARRPGNRVRFEVEDTGIGIAPEALPLLFREFSQVENGLARRFEGSGLGLAICKRLVEAMGGEIGVDSVVGLGSRFWFEIPGGNVHAPEGDPVAADRDPVARSYAGRVLVVEDNATNQLVTCAILRQLGLESAVVGDGAAALDMVGRERFDLVLIDMQMPVLDGPSTARAMRGRGLVLPIVGLSANVLVSDRQICLDAGMNDFLSKPVTIDKLAAALDPWLAAARPGDPGERGSAEPEMGTARAVGL